MKSIIKNKLNQFGFNTEECDAIDNLLRFAKEINFSYEENEKSEEVNRRIRNELSLSQELAIIRKAIVKINEKLEIENEEFNDYNDFIEECKNANPNT